MATYNLLFRPQALYTPFRKVAFLPLYLLYLGVPLFPHFLSNMALYGAETWTLRPADQKYLESFEMWCWRRMEKTVGPIM